MSLTPAEEQKVQDWLARKVKAEQFGALCVCGNATNWNLVGRVRLDLIDPSGGVQIGGPHVPTIAIVCADCGHVRLFAAKALGL